MRWHVWHQDPDSKPGHERMLHEVFTTEAAAIRRLDELVMQGRRRVQIKEGSYDD